jgi:hypothetical protein
MVWAVRDLRREASRTVYSISNWLPPAHVYSLQLTSASEPNPAGKHRCPQLFFGPCVYQITSSALGFGLCPWRDAPFSQRTLYKKNLCKCLQLTRRGCLPLQTSPVCFRFASGESITIHSPPPGIDPPLPLFSGPFIRPQSEALLQLGSFAHIRPLVRIPKEK